MRPVENQRGKEVCLPTSPKTVKTQLAFLGSLVLLWLLYTIFYTLHPSDDLAVFLEFIPGGLAIGILVAAGLSPKDWYLRVGRISIRGLVLLAAMFAFMPFILLTGRWIGWKWIAALVYAPASAVSQELFFRGALLPAFITTFKGKGRTGLAIFLQAALFALWHAPKLFTEAPLAGAVAASIVTFVGGMIWGWQVQHDRTVVWALAQHILFLMIQSLFTWD